MTTPELGALGEPATTAPEGITNPPGAAAYNASKSAVRTLTEQLAFALSSEAVAGKATHSLEPDGDSLDESFYPKLRTQLGIHHAAPVVDGALTFERDGREHTLRLLGLDPFVESEFHANLGLQGGTVSEATPLLSQSGAVLLSKRQAEASR